MVPPPAEILALFLLHVAKDARCRLHPLHPAPCSGLAAHVLARPKTSKQQVTLPNQPKAINDLSSACSDIFESSLLSQPTVKSLLGACDAILFGPRLGLSGLSRACWFVRFGMRVIELCARPSLWFEGYVRPDPAACGHHTLKVAMIATPAPQAKHARIVPSSVSQEGDFATHPKPNRCSMNLKHCPT